MAAWAYAAGKADGDQGKAQSFVANLFHNVPVLDTGARGSTTTFVQREIGDVLITWENEAFLALEELGKDKFEIIVPSLSIRAEPPVAIVDTNVDRKGTRKVAEAYLAFLYSPEGQKLAAKHFYRPYKPESADPADLARFPKLNLVSIDDPQFGGWTKVQADHFAEGESSTRSTSRQTDHALSAYRCCSNHSSWPGLPRPSTGLGHEEKQFMCLTGQPYRR